MYLQDPDVTLYHGDAFEVLRTLPDRSVHMCATSPPFYGLRDYGMPGQIGLEESPDEWVARLVEVFREVRRVLRDDGTLWVEIGDSYNSLASNQKGLAGSGMNERPKYLEKGQDNFGGQRQSRLVPGLKTKDLLGQPWLLAFALRADGWYLRSEIIWARPNPMPESVTDRPTKAHSTVFLLSKSPRYFYDQEAIREEFQSRPQQRLTKNVDMPLGAARVAAGVQQGNPQGGNHVNRFAVQKETLLYECQKCGRTCSRSRREKEHSCRERRELRAAPRRGTLACLRSQRPLRLDHPHRTNPLRPLRNLAAEAVSANDPGGNVRARGVPGVRCAVGAGCGGWRTSADRRAQPQDVPAAEVRRRHRWRWKGCGARPERIPEWISACQDNARLAFRLRLLGGSSVCDGSHSRHHPRPLRRLRHLPPRSPQARTAGYRDRVERGLL
jgi:DNA modification methylase